MSDFQDANLVQQYQRTDEKPDKKFSILPTMMDLIGDVTGKTVVDLGCGSGFFTKPIAERGARLVIGVDNSMDQIKLAQTRSLANITYIFGDVFVDRLPTNDLTVASFVLCYSADIPQLERLLQNIHQSLTPGGKMIAVMDMPNGRDLRKYGSLRTYSEKKDGSEMWVELFDDVGSICRFRSHYYSPSLVEKTALSVGFKEFHWKKPIISLEGIQKYGQEFWHDYLSDSELGYFVATK